jgi:hypothetical protein
MYLTMILIYMSGPGAEGERADGVENRARVQGENLRENHLHFDPAGGIFHALGRTGRSVAW